MRCIHCGDPHQSRDAEICGACGNPLPVGELSSIRQETGKPSSATSLPPLALGERRHVTILMADLSGYTGFNEAFDPEVVAEVMDRIEHEARRIVHEHDGVVNQFVGDEILALFGVPSAHEDDAQRAVSTALELHRYVRELDVELGPKLAQEAGRSPDRPYKGGLRLHTGIHSGLVLAKLQDPRHGLYGLRGDTINVAARLRSLAPPGEILVSETTHQSIAPFFRTELVESFALKGRNAPVTAYRIVAPSDATTAFEAAQQCGLAPLVGRAGELALLFQGYERARAGHGQLMTMSGHAGVGKSRLFYEFRQRVEPDAAVFQTRCEAFGKVPPYQAFLRPLRQALRIGDARAGESPAACMEATLAELGVAEYRAVFSSLLAFDTEAIAPPSMRGEQLRDLIVRALVDLFLAIARTKPVVLLLEDWHFADEGSSTAAVHLAESIGDRPILIVINHRPMHPVPWSALPATTIELAPLSPAETAQLSHSLLGEGQPSSLGAKIHEHTGGNALFVEQVCRALADQRRTLAEPPAKVGENLERLPIPNTVQAVLRARIDSLHASDAEILRLASVLGTEFTLAKLELLVSPAQKEVDLQDCMRRLSAADLVHREQERDDATFRFKHSITQEVAYQTLLKQRRRDLHVCAARAIEQANESALDEHCEALAFHYGMGEEYEHAASYAEKAGDKAARTFSLEEARQQYRQALSALDRLSASPERLRRRVDVGLKWAAACMFNPAAEQLEVLKVSLEHAERIGYGSGLAYTLCWLGCIEYALGDQQNAIARFSDCMPQAVRLGDDRLVAQLHVNLGQCHAAATDYGKALEHLNEGLERKDRVPSIRAGTRSTAGRGSGTGRAYALGYLGLVHGDMGQFDRAYSYLDEALSIVRSARSRAVEGSILTQLAMVQLWQGDWAACEATARAMQGTAEQVHGPYILAMSKTVSGYARFVGYGDGEGIELLRAAAAWLQATQVGLTLSWNQACLAEALALSSREDEARAHAQSALERREASDLLGEVAAHRALGLAEAGGHGSWEAARTALDRALAAAGRKGSERDAAITRLRGAAVALRFGQDQRAAEWLAECLPQFESMKMDWYRSEAERLTGRSPRDFG